MAQTALQGSPISTSGDLPAVGSTAPEFTLTNGDLGAVSSSDFAGKRVILNIFPSIDTGTCATSVKTFNEKASSLDNTEVVCVSADLPFAHGRFCGAEGVENVTTASTFKSPDFLKSYGVGMVDGPLEGLCARAVVVLDESGSVLHNELVSEIADEPNYDSAIAALG